jgi:glucose-6-phosphate 1-epimerase
MTAPQPSDWRQDFEIPGRVRFMEGGGDLPLIRVNTDWSSLDIYLHGAHVTHFQKKNEPPLLFLSQVSQFEPSKPIRGGIPVILPWFGGRAGEVFHGIARLRSWEMANIIASKDGAIALHLRLAVPGGVAGFPPFSADYVVTVRDTLSLELSVTNQSATQDLVFENCFHTYFHVGDITNAAVTGLNGSRYLDKVDDMREKTESADALRFYSEVDRIYLDTTRALEIHDPALGRTILIEKENSASTVVWNPWADRAREMSDFGDEEYLRMACVESGNVAANRLTLAPGKSSTLKVKLSSH